MIIFQAAINPFQSLIGIKSDFRARFGLGEFAPKKFQSLIGIKSDFRWAVSRKATLGDPSFSP